MINFNPDCMLLFCEEWDL